MTIKYNKLNDEEVRVIINKGTEPPFQGQYTDTTEQGLYICKQCDSPLYRSEHKFLSSCGWPSFDDEIDGAIKRIIDADGRRTEILCANCEGHLGHVFEGERLTDKNIRHCVNSISMNFIRGDKLEENAKTINKAYFAGGCFWGVEHLLQQQSGVISVVSGYMGGHVENPSYKQVCQGDTGHLEVVEVTYDQNKINYETLCRLFFEIHDPTQSNGQGPDLGPQYASAIFYQSENEKLIIENLIAILKDKNYDVVTKLLPLATFWKAEDYHQDYYQKSGSQPYCHSYQKKF